MSLLKRNGPLLLGIYLERTRSNDVYLPLFHVHALMWPSSDMTLGLCQGLAYKGMARLREEIPVKEHELRYEEAAERLATQVPELMATDTTLSRIIRLYWDFVENNRDPAICRFPLALWADEILLWTWAGETARAQRCFDRALKRMTAWPPHEVLPEWQETILKLMDKERLEAVIQEESKRHGVEHIPCYGLLADDVSTGCLADEGAAEQ